MKNNTIYDFLDLVRGRPGMYVGGNKLSNLYQHIGGYQLCLHFKGIKEEVGLDFGFFHDYIAIQYNYFESTTGWSNMLIDQFGDTKEALDIFFNHLDRFREKYKGMGIHEVERKIKSEHSKIRKKIEKDRESDPEYQKMQEELKKIRNTYKN